MRHVYLCLYSSLMELYISIKGVFCFQKHRMVNIEYAGIGGTYMMLTKRWWRQGRRKRIIYHT